MLHYYNQDVPASRGSAPVQQDLRHHHLALHEAADLAQNRPLEDDIDVWRYAIFELHARNYDNDVSLRVLTF